ncbi:delta(1)-pyrroline-2-carboxylate reductase family protein [Pseudomonas sp. RC4D1]|uniref:bifunctional Delta(1)-pyrroline-2-carboxylate/Delta(1)-piperideine-2- carboxylate reductase n=1 Tax=Pseudomonas sp. RC4D1 TaxID=2834407 RepID=UPI001BD1B174|nr:bifunctional Delta(1)-pyrroline-2-carboxylate/Delta(1)-piperideine-2-carboxylate reductase [Pseudomonas sp. RC4D1]MBS7560191.1 delta(1)-pyrroline-2-carboxylate reductase family protein [Pseudomonas sp. RC4D1]
MTLSLAQDSRDEFIVCDRANTAAALDFHALVEGVRQAMLQYENGEIISPERMVVLLGRDAVLLSMPATAADIAVHKLVNVCPGNQKLGLPTIHGQVTAYNAETGNPLFTLDGPEVTGRRTAAVSILGIRTFLATAPVEILIIGTGTQAHYHLQALSTVYPEARIWVRGVTFDDAQAFCIRNAELHQKLSPCAPDVVPDVQVVITVTTSKSAFYEETAMAGRLIIGVGAFKPEMAEISKHTLQGSQIFIDDLHGGKHEAGDLIQADVDWTTVRSFTSALQNTPDLSRPIVLKSVGTAAWDLAACRIARKALNR